MNDFELDDFNFEFDFEILDDSAKTGIMTPVLEKPVTVKYKYAQDLVNQLQLNKGINYYAILSGNFIFGDIFEAWAEKLKIKQLYLSTLGMSVNNVDSLVNCIKQYNVEQINLIVSHYFFGVERNRMVRYLYEEILGYPFKVAVAGSHSKIALIETDDLFITIHGSANLSSNHNIEQLMIIENRQLFEFNKEIFDKIFLHQTIIDGNKTDYKAAKNSTAKTTWERVISNG